MGSDFLNFLNMFCNKLFTTFDRLDGTIRLVTKLFQQDWYSHDVTILLQPGVVNFATIVLQQVCIRVVCATLTFPSSLLQGFPNVF